MIWGWCRALLPLPPQPPYKSASAYNYTITFKATGANKKLVQKLKDTRYNWIVQNQNINPQFLETSIVTYVNPHEE